MASILGYKQHKVTIETANSEPIIFYSVLKIWDYEDNNEFEKNQVIELHRQHYPDAVITISDITDT